MIRAFLRWSSPLFFLVLPAIVYADPHRYDITATYDARKHRIEGIAKITLTNTGETPLSEIFLFLYPNLFLKNDPQEGGVHPYPIHFNSGFMEIRAIYDQAQNPISVSDFFGIKILEAIRLDKPIAPGASFELFIQFVTQIPERFGPFGQFRNSVTLQGGWHPYLPPLVNGKWDLQGSPPMSQFHVNLTLPIEMDPVAGTPLKQVHQNKTNKTVSGDARLPFFSLHLGRGAIHLEEKREGTTLSYSGPEEDQAYGTQVLASATTAVSFFLSAWGPLPDMDIRLVHAYLYQDLVMVGANLLYADAKLFKVIPALKRFHDVRVARGVFHLLFSEILPHEELWVIETMAALMANQYARDQYADTPDLKSWLKPIAFFPFIDGLFYSKDIPLRQVYFNETAAPHESFLSFHQPLHQGILGSTRLIKQMGEAKLKRALEDYKAQVDAQTNPRFTDVLLLRYPEMKRWVATRHTVFPPLDFGIEQIERRHVNGSYHTTLHLKKEGVGIEPVAIVLQEKHGDKISLSWNGEGDRYTTDVVTASPISVVTLDPEEKVFDVKRGNNRNPRLWKVLLNRYALGYNLTTQFLRYNAGLLFQPVHDAADTIRLETTHVDQVDTQSLQYHRRFGNRHLLITGVLHRAFRSAVGVTPTDADSTVSVSYTFHVAGIPGLTDTLEWLIGASPRLALGFGYEQGFTYGDSLRTVRFDLRRSISFARYHEIGTRFFMGFSRGALFRDSRFFLGGESGLRGYTPLRFEGEDISLLSWEYRFPLLYETDINLFGLALTHTLQGALFADAGSIADGNEAFHRAEIKYDVGAGLRWFVDSFGIVPVILRADVAWPIHSPVMQENVPHYYISAGQPF